MENLLDENIDKMLNENELNMFNNDDDYYPRIKLPSKNDLYYFENKNFDELTEDVQTKIINQFFLERHHFRVKDWEPFLPNFKAGEREAAILMSIFYAINIFFENENIRFGFNKGFYYNLKTIFKNKEFTNMFSKEFQMKVIFSPNEQLILMFKNEITKLIADKLRSIDAIEKIKAELPKLIMENFDNESIKTN